MRRPTWLALLVLVLLAACGQDPPPTAPRNAGGPSYSISDGAHGGNPNFFFLPPLLPSPTGSPSYRAGQFNARLSPTVEICRLRIVGVPLADGHCDGATVVARWRASAVRLSVADELYQVNWKTDSVALDVSAFYRIRVLVGDRELGFTDIDPVTRDQLKDYQSGALIPLAPGRTLPIKFRIQNGALAGTGSNDYVERNVPATGGKDTLTILVNGAPTQVVGTLVTTDHRQAGAFFPNGWLPPGYTSVAVSISRVPVPPGQATTSCHNTPGIIEFEGCYQYATYPTLPYRTDAGVPPYTQFYQSVTVQMCTTLPESDPRFDALSLFKSGPTEPTTVLPETDPRFSLMCDQFAASRANAPTIGLRAGPAAAFARLAAGLDGIAHSAWDGLAVALTPRSAYAVDLGMGGSTRAFSNIGFGIRQSLQPVGPVDLTVLPGATSTLAQVRVVAEHDHAANGQLTRPTYIGVPGVPVTFTVTAGGGTVPNIALPGGAGASTAVVTDTLGYARVPWTLGSAGANALTATIMGGMSLPYAGGTAVNFTATPTGSSSAAVTIGGVVRDRSSRAVIPQALTATLTAADGSGTVRPVNYIGGTTGSLADTLRANVPADIAFFGKQALLTIDFTNGSGVR